MKRWLKRVWHRPLIKAEAWDYMTCAMLSQETFVNLMLDLRREALKLHRWGKPYRTLRAEEEKK